MLAMMGAVVAYLNSATKTVSTIVVDASLNQIGTGSGNFSFS